LAEGIDSSLPSVAVLATVEGTHSPYFTAVPPLAWMAGVATLADLVINRILVRVGSETWSRGTLGRLDSWGAFACNLSVVSSLVALSFCIASFTSHKSALPFSTRAGVASFGCVLISIVTAMTVVPLERTNIEWVFVVLALAHSLILLLVLAGLHWRSTRATSLALVLTLIATLSSILSMMVTSAGERMYWEPTERLSNALRWSGELAYLAVPIALALPIARSLRATRGKLALMLAGLTAGLVAAAISSWKYLAGGDLAELLYGAVRLDFLPNGDFVLYAIPLGIGWAVTVAAVLSKHPASRETGAALLLLLSSGYAPRTPSALVTTVLGVALLARTAIARAQRPVKTRS